MGNNQVTLEGLLERQTREMAVPHPNLSSPHHSTYESSFSPSDGIAREHPETRDDKPWTESGGYQVPKVSGGSDHL